MKPIQLPCGAHAVVTPFNGRAQNLLVDEDLAKSAERLDLVLAEIVHKLNDQAPSPKALLDLPSGSRTRLLIEARRQTYGDDVAVTAQCPDCGRALHRDVSLADVDDVPYPEGLAPVEFRAGNGMAFTLGWGTGHTERDFVTGRAQKMWGPLDETLSRVKAVDGQPKGPRFFAKTVPGDVLDAVRRAVVRMVPVLLLPEVAAERAEAAAEAAAGGADAAPAPVQGGPRTRVQVACAPCNRRFGWSLERAPDFLFRGPLASLDD